MVNGLLGNLDQQGRQQIVRVVIRVVVRIGHMQQLMKQNVDAVDRRRTEVQRNVDLRIVVPGPGIQRIGTELLMNVTMIDQLMKSLTVKMTPKERNVFFAFRVALDAPARGAGAESRPASVHT